MLPPTEPSKTPVRLLLCLLREARARDIDSLAELGYTDRAGTVVDAPSRAATDHAPLTTLAAAPLGQPSDHDDGAPAPAAARISLALRRLADDWPIGKGPLAAYLDLVDHRAHCRGREHHHREAPLGAR